MSFFDRHRIQEPLLRRRSTTPPHVSVVGTDNDFEDDVATLREYSFITATGNGDTFEMHSLVQLATRTWQEKEGQLDKWRNQFISNLCAKLPSSSSKEWEKCKSLFPHVRMALAQRPSDPIALQEWALLLYNAASHAYEYVRLSEVEQMFLASIEVRRNLLSEEHEYTLNTIVWLGMVKQTMGEHEKAEAITRHTLAVRQRVHRDEHRKTLRDIVNLGLILHL